MVNEDSEYKIEKGVPISGRANDSKVKRALRTLSRAPIGSSVYFPTESTTRAGSAANTVAGKGWYTVRAMGDGSRVWKTAEPLPQAIHLVA